MVELHAGMDGQCAKQFVALTVFASETHWINRPQAQGHEVAENGSRSAGLAAHVDDIVHRQAGFERSLPFGRIDFEIAVETKVAHYGHPKAGVSSGDGVQ